MTNNNSTYKRLGDYIEQRREKNKGFDVPIRGVSKEGFIPPKQQDADVNLYNVFYKNDFVFNPARMELNSIALNEDLEQGICSSLYEIFYIKDTNVLDPLYLNLLIKTDHFTRFCEFVGWGSVREYCRFADISEYYIEVPPIEEQHKIVSHFNAIRTRIANNKQTIAKLEEAAQALYRKMFVDGIDVERLPEGWRMGCLGEVIEIKYGKDYKQLSNGNIPLYGSGGIMGFVNKSLYNGPSILIPRKGSLNNILLVSTPFWSVDTMFYSIMKINNSLHYIYQYLKKIDFLSIDMGSAVPSMTTDHLNHMDLIIPCQDKLNEFENIMNTIYTHCNMVKKENEKLTNLLFLMA